MYENLQLLNLDIISENVFFFMHFLVGEYQKNILVYQ